MDIEIYLNPKTFDIPKKGLSPLAKSIVYDMTRTNRNYDVGVLDRIVFYGKVHPVSRWSANPSLAFNVSYRLWSKHNGVWHLREFKPSTSLNDFQGYYEFLGHMKAVEEENKK